MVRIAGALLLAICFAGVVSGLQVAEHFGDSLDEDVSAPSAMDELNALIQKAENVPVTEYPALLKEARELASKITADEKGNLLRVFVIMRIHVTEEITKLEKTLTDTKIIIKSKIAEKELKITTIKIDTRAMQEKYEVNQAARLREIATVKRIKELLLKIMENESSATLKITKETKTESGTIVEGKNTHESTHKRTENGKVVVDSSSASSSSHKTVTMNPTKTTYEHHEATVSHHSKSASVSGSEKTTGSASSSASSSESSSSSSSSESSSSSAAAAASSSATVEVSSSKSSSYSKSVNHTSSTTTTMEGDKSLLPNKKELEARDLAAMEKSLGLE